MSANQLKIKRARRFLESEGYIVLPDEKIALMMQCDRCNKTSVLPNGLGGICPDCYPPQYFYKRRTEVGK